ISGTKDVNVFASGSVDLAGGTGGAVTIEGVNVNVGSESAPTHSLSLTAGETILNVALSDARITASKTVNVFATGDVGLTGGSASAAMIEGTTVNIGSAGVPVQKLSLTGGSSPTGGTTVSHKSDAGIVATGDLAAHVAGNLGLTGGATDIVPGAGIFTTATALAKLQGENVLLDVRGNLVMKGGAAKAQNGGNTADSSVGIIATSSFNPASRIAGDLTIQGGTAEATPAAGASSNAQSTATLDVGGIL